MFLVSFEWVAKGLGGVPHIDDTLETSIGKRNKEEIRSLISKYLHTSLLYSVKNHSKYTLLRV